MRSSKYCPKRVICLLVVVCLVIGMAPSIAVAVPPPASQPFTDIAGHWAHEAIGFMVEGGFMEGTSATTFEPNALFSRAMAVTILYRMAEEPPVQSATVFTDVAPGRWYSDAVAWAYSSGVVQGIGDGRFAPAVNITRQEMATILHRFASAQGYDVAVASSVTLDFPDANLINDWAVGAMRWAVQNGVMRGTDLGELNPRSNATRAEAATVLTRFVRENERLREPFVFTISVEETSLPQGERLVVDVELKNNSGEDHVIVYSLLFSPSAPFWRNSSGVSVAEDPPLPQSRFFEADSIIRDTFCMPLDLEPGRHELRFRAAFALRLQDNYQSVQIQSNTVMFTVQSEYVPPLNEDFVLTISVEETSLPQGETFRANVELKNNSGEDQTITYSTLFWPDIPNWNPFGCGYGCPRNRYCERPVSPFDMPLPRPRFLSVNDAIRTVWSHLGAGVNPLPPGTHELRFIAFFDLNWEQENQERIAIWSNTVVLTVLP
ncbi:MAG: S-layer homology domain-containing protein [Oscillospiraceae bacterium]|nr:S-layer homology domain-containing protein [Oscillospiraceae bacterium]